MLRSVTFAIGMLTFLFVAGCTPAAQITPPVRTVPVVQPSWTPIVTPTTPATPKPTTAATPTPAAVAKDECVVCHTSKDALVKNAKPEVKKESESEGVG